MAIQNVVQILEKTLAIWTRDTEEGRAFLSTKAPGKSWELSPMLEVVHPGRDSAWVPLQRVEACYWPAWCSLLDTHLDVRGKVLRGAGLSRGYRVA